MEKINVLDKGYVELIDYMGSDYRILESARISTGAEAKKGDDKDKGLIRYMYRNGHLSPYEQCVFTFRIKMPIFVMRQFVRHRTQCLAPDTKIFFKSDNTREVRKIEIENLYKKWKYGIFGNTNEKPDISNIEYDKYYNAFQIGCWFQNRIEEIEKIIPYTIKKADNNKKIKLYLGKDIHFILDYITENFYNFKKEIIKKMRVRVLNEDTNILQYSNITDVIYSGKKPIYEVELEDGYKIKSSVNHLYYTSEGWKKLIDFMHLDKKIIYWDDISIYTNGEESYKNKETLYDLYWVKKMNLDSISNLLGCSKHTVRKWLKKHNLQDSKFERFIGNIPWNKNKKYKQNLSEEARKVHSENAKINRSGSKSNWWKGGITSKRNDIARWTSYNAKTVFKRDGYKCAITGRKDNLVCHHIIPVYQNNTYEYAKNINNLITLNSEIHRKIHTYNLESVFSEWVQQKKDLTKFFEVNNIKLKNYKPKGKRLFSAKLKKIVNIKYIGESDTYDLSISEPYHNFVANGIIVHNSINEISARYSILEDEYYTPESWREQGVINHQGSGNEFDSAENSTMTLAYVEAMDKIYDSYHEMIDKGVAKEMSRFVMPVAQYTEIYTTMNLRNLFHLLELRLHQHAQYEIRVYAEAILKILEGLEEFKWSVEIFKDELEINNTVQELKNKYKTDYKTLQKVLNKLKD